MAVSVVATAGATNANSYVTVAEASAYLAERLNVSAWTGASADEKAQAVISATRRLDQESFVGTKASDTQSLEWPRVGTTDRNGWLYASDTIPVPIQHATTELALAMLGSDLLADSGLEAFAEVTVDVISVKPNAARSAGTLPANVARLVSHLSTTSGGAAVLVRRG